MKKLIILALASCALAACSRVEPGHVGVKVERYGSAAGVQDKALGVGTYWTGIGTDIYEYPIYTSNYAWTNETRCDDQNTCTGANEEFSFQDKSGLIVTADVSIAYRVDPVKAPILFQKYRTDMAGIVAGPLRNAVRSALVDGASGMSVEEIYGAGKTRLINQALANVRRYFEPFGLHVEQLYWAGPIRIPQSILDQINARTKNEQQALAAQANVATVKANAEAAVAKASGEADATKVKAIAEAEAIRIRAQALANNPKIVGYEWVQKWDGAMPSTVYCSASQPCVQTGQ